MGVFDFFIVIPQMVAAGILGFLLKTFFGNISIYALIIGGISMVWAGLLCLIVEDKETAVAPKKKLAANRCESNDLDAKQTSTIFKITFLSR